MEFVKEYLKLAHDDLEASKLLHENRLYPQSLFYFSQSVEKANKALALTSNKFTEKDMRQINHNPMRIYKQLMINQKNSTARTSKLYSDFSELPEIRGKQYFLDYIDNLGFEDNIEFTENQLRALAKIQDESFNQINISKQEINNLLLDIRKLEEQSTLIIDSLKAFAYNHYDWDTLKELLIIEMKNPEMAQIIDQNTFLNENIITDIDFGEIMKIILDEIIKSIYGVRIIDSLYQLAIISMPHSIVTRYPDENVYPSKLYTSELPIVENLPVLLDIQTKTLLHLNAYCQKYVFE